MRLAEKTIMIAARYRQWNHLADVAQNHTDGVEGQVERIKLVKNQVEKARAISKHIILMGDINIDMSENKEKTRYAKNEKPSLIDHISTNMVNQIDNISTDKQPISDHCMVSFNLHSLEQIEQAKFLFTQDWRQVTKNLVDFGAEYEPELTEMWYKHNIHSMWEN